MKVVVDSMDYSNWSKRELCDYLRSKGLDLTKPITEFESLIDCCGISFVGESLPDRCVSFINTVIGIVPITEPWENT